MGFFSAIWAIIAGGFSTLIGSNSESRKDFIAINNALESINAALEAQIARQERRIDAMQAQLDKMQSEAVTTRTEVIALRTENSDLRRELAESNRRHDEDEIVIGNLKARVAELEARNCDKGLGS